MRYIVHFLAAGAIGAAIALSGAPAFAKTAKECDADWTANKAAIQASGQTKKAYVAACRSSDAASPTATAAPASTASPVRRSAPSVAAGGKSAKDCNAEYAANKAAIQGTKEKKKDFVSACRAGTETIPGGTAAAPAPTPASLSPTSAPAPSPTPTAAPAPKPRTPAPQPTASRAAPTPAVVTASETQAQAKCPGALVVWVNTSSKVYHFKGTRSYGTTKAGTYMCESEAMGAGDRAAKNEKHP